MGMKFKNGKFVERTPEEEKRLAEYFAAADKPASKSNTPKLTEPFIRLSMRQLDRLIPHLSKSPVVTIFLILCHESFRHRGATFIFPSDKLAEFGGFSPWTQRRAITFLEEMGLIAVQRVCRKPPLIRVL
jgi:hypothetical protein